VQTVANAERTHVFLSVGDNQVISNPHESWVSSFDELMLPSRFGVVLASEKGRHVDVVEWCESEEGEKKRRWQRSRTS
jgi:hypothetical protein